jgi:hypothetical protein
MHALNSGQRTADSRQRTVDSGQWITVVTGDQWITPSRRDPLHVHRRDAEDAETKTE